MKSLIFLNFSVFNERPIFLKILFPENNSDRVFIACLALRYNCIIGGQRATKLNNKLYQCAARKRELLEKHFWLYEGMNELRFLKMTV